MQNLALTGSVVLGNRQIYQLFDQFERAFWQKGAAVFELASAFGLPFF